MRNEIAHAIAEQTNDLTSAQDDMQLQYRAIMWLPPLEIMARRMLKNEFAREFLVGVPDLGESGTPSRQPGETPE
ncbi:MAG: hypothetical protein ACREKS_00725 [Candidatus Rokuibacteriota bacterium]